MKSNLKSKLYKEYNARVSDKEKELEELDTEFSKTKAEHEKLKVDLVSMSDEKSKREKEFYSISKSLDDKNQEFSSLSQAVDSLNERQFNDIKDIRSYSPSDLKIETLRDDYRIILGWYCNKTSGKKVNASFEEILNVLRLIIVELIKRGKTTFHVKRLTPCSQEAFKKAVAKDFPKGIKVPVSDNDYDGIYLPKPHSKLIAQKKKTHVLKSEDFTNAFKKPLYFLDEDFIYGYVLLSKPKKVSLEAAMKRQKEHFVTKADIKKWDWEDKDLYISKVKKLKLWDRPVSFDIPKGIKTFITFRKLYPFLRKVKRIDTLNVRPSGKTQGKEITLNDILKPLSQAIMEKEDFVTLTGAVVNQGKTVNDLDLVIRKPKPDDQRDDTGFKFRIYRGLDKEVGDRIHWLYDSFNGSMTSHIGLYNRWLIPSSVPIKEIESLVDKYPLQSTIHKMSDILNPDSDKIRMAHEKLHKQEGGNE